MSPDCADKAATYGAQECRPGGGPTTHPDILDFRLRGNDDIADAGLPVVPTGE